MPYNSGSPTAPRSLTPEQTQALSTWLALHRSRLKLDLLGDYVPSLIVKLHGQDTTLRMNIMETAVIYYDGHHQYSADFPAADIAKLRQSVGEGSTANQRLERP
jgi:hypothetical protein